MPRSSSLESYRKSFFDAAKCPFLVLRPDSPRFTIEDVNPAYLEMMRAKRENLIGKSIFDIFPSDYAAPPHHNLSPLRASLLRAAETQQITETDAVRFDIPVSDGFKFERRFWRYTNTPLTDSKGTIQYILHSPVDVTALYDLTQFRKSAVNTAKYKHLLSVFRQVPVGIQILKGSDYIIDMINPALCRIFGKRENELLHHSVLNIIKEEERHTFKQIMDLVMASGEPFSGTEIPFSVLRDDKEEEVYINLINQPYYEEDHTISGIISIVTDVTSQVILRKKLEESEQRLKLAIESSEIGIWDLNLQTNQAAAYFKNAELQASIDTTTIDSALESLMELVIPEDKIMVNKAFADAVQTGHVNVQLRVQWPDGSIHWIQLTGEAILNEVTRKPARILGTSMDITNAKELERKKDEMISIVSHELKTPVTSLNALAQVLEKKFTSIEEDLAGVMLKKMVIQVSRLSVLIKDLLDITRIESGKMQLREVEYNFDELALDIIAEIQRTTSTHEIVIEKIQPVTCYGDKDKVGQVLVNLLTNAIKYSPGKDKVIVSVEADEQEITFRVQDFGVGIPEDKQGRIFDRFFRVSEEKQFKFSGLGLGLYITAEIVKRMNGKIWFTSSLNEGSTFYVSFPIKNF